MFWPQSVENRAALRTAIGVLIAVLISFQFHLQTPYWSGMTVVMITNLYTGTIIDKAMMRIVGTIIGAVLGFYWAGIIVNSLMLYLISCFLLISVSVYYYNYSFYGYAWLLGALCAFLILSQLAFNPGNAFIVAIWRPTEIGIGVIVAAISAYVFFPNHIKDNIVQQIDALFAQFIVEFQQLEDFLLNEQPNLVVIATTNLELKKKVRKATDLIDALNHELGVNQSKKDTLRAVLEIFYNITRQIHYFIINEPVLKSVLYYTIYLYLSYLLRLLMIARYSKQHLISRATCQML